MIKLPVVLEEHRGDWQQAVCAAVNTRKRLAGIAREEPRYVRPLLLIQAENAGQPADWKAVKAYLLETEKLDDTEIAVHTGDTLELADLDLFAPGPVTTILTVQALKEGWDCSFAYVFCSTANRQSATDVEQLLGRVLRMPYAKKREHPELNKAYAHVQSERFYEAAQMLKDRLVAMGFDAQEAAGAVEDKQGDLPLLDERPVFTVVLTQAPDVSGLTPEEWTAVEVETTAGGRTEVRVTGVVPEGLMPAILASVPEAGRAGMTERVREHNAAWMPSPARRGVPFRVPRLTIEDADGERIPFTDEALDEAVAFNLKEYPADLSGFRFDETTQRYTLDVAGEALVLRLMGAGDGTFTFAAEDWTPLRLVGWLAARRRDPGVSASALDAWVLQAVTRRLEAAPQDLPVLVRGKFLLLRLLAGKMAEAKASARQKAYQELLFERGSSVLASEEFSFRYPPE